MSPDQVLALVAQFQALPLPQQIVVGTVIAVATLVIGRFLHNTLFNSLARRPPIFEGVPYVGGLIKFAWVSGGVAGSSSNLLQAFFSDTYRRLAACRTAPST